MAPPPPAQPDEPYEVLVVGAGPAGLSAALYLARYNRRVAVFDSGQGRSTWHQVNHNYLGFPGGVAARRLRELGREQLAEYPQVAIRQRKIEALERAADGTFVARGQSGAWTGRAAILCTGVVDHYPRFEGWEEYVGRSMFWCITCDGYGCQDARVVVVGNTDAAATEALQLQRFTHQLTVLTDSQSDEISEAGQARLARAGIPLVRDRIAEVVGHDGQFECLRTEGGREIPLDRLFTQHGSTPHSELAGQVGAALNDQGYVKVDTEQKTNVPGFYAAGDVTRLHSHQVTTAVHEGGTAASAANYELYPPELKEP